MRRFSDLTEQQILALAISSEEEDSRIYRGFAEGLRAQFPASARVFDEMAESLAKKCAQVFRTSGFTGKDASFSVMAGRSPGHPRLAC